jgi:hypothetical protein
MVNQVMVEQHLVILAVMLIRNELRFMREIILGKKRHVFIIRKQLRMFLKK